MRNNAKEDVEEQTQGKRLCAVYITKSYFQKAYEFVLRLQNRSASEIADSLNTKGKKVMNSYESPVRPVNSRSTM
jgi:hypothetical protein